MPEAVWNFKIGGLQVLRKWLSYREAAIIGRPLTVDEVRQFRSVARRLTKLVLMAPALDANYRAATGSVDQVAEEVGRVQCVASMASDLGQRLGMGEPAGEDLGTVGAVRIYVPASRRQCLRRASEP